MCHSVEMYVPKITRSAAEEALRGVDRAPLPAVAPRLARLLVRLAARLADAWRARAVAR